MLLTSFKPHHINGTAEDMMGNKGIGRYFFLPGSEGRAHEIAQRFENLIVKQHERGHNLYLGQISCDDHKIDVATISTGMGCPSTEIILHELYHLGAKRFLRLGTAGSMQPSFVRSGHFVNAHAVVRDEDTTTHYVPTEVPAVASLEFISAILYAAGKLGLANVLHTGIVHCKSSLYAREFGTGPRSLENRTYIDLMTRYGVLASEMETSALFVQCNLYNHEIRQNADIPTHRVLAGSLLNIITTVEEAFSNLDHAGETVKHGIDLAIESVKTLAIQELVD